MLRSFPRMNVYRSTAASRREAREVALVSLSARTASCRRDLLLCCSGGNRERMRSRVGVMAVLRFFAAGSSGAHEPNGQQRE